MKEFVIKFKKKIINFPTNHPWWVLIGLIFINALIAFSGSTLKAVDNNSSYWFYTTIGSLSTNALAVYVVLFLGFHHFQTIYEILVSKNRMNFTYELWESTNAKKNGFKIYFGGDLGSMRDDMPTKSCLATHYSIHLLTDNLIKCYGKKIKIHTEPFPLATKENHIEKHMDIIILGGHVAIPKLKQFSESSGFIFYQNFDDPDNRRIIFSAEKSRNYVSKLGGDASNDVDYALLTIVVEKHSGRHLYWFSGNFGIGTYGAVIMATRKNHPKLRKPTPGRYNQYIIRVNDIYNERITESHGSIDIAKDASTDLPSEFNINTLWDI